MVIPPLGEHTLTFDIFGKPGLLEATIHIDYAHLGTAQDEMKGVFYTRQLKYPVFVTVNGSVEIPRFNVLPLNDDFVWAHDKGKLDVLEPVEESQKVLNAGRSLTSSDDWCLVAMDLRNVWPQPICV